MRFVKYFTTLSIMLLCLLCSCAKGEYDLKVEISPSNKTLFELSTKIYDDSKLLEITSFNSTMDDLNIQYPIECLRQSNSIYRASYLGNDCIAIILFDSSGNIISGNIYYIQRLKSDFIGLTEGQSLEKVREIDPNGEYLFLYTGRNDTPKVSSHYTIDGYLITIEYDDFNTIKNINEELI